MKMFLAAACFGTLTVSALGVAGETAAARRASPTSATLKTPWTPCRQRATTS